MTEKLIQRAVRLYLGTQPDIVVWRNNVGVANQRGLIVRYGLCVGSADIIGIGPGGRFLAFEVKTATGRVSDEQAQFLELVRVMGGYSMVVRSVADAKRAVEEIREAVR